MTLPTLSWYLGSTRYAAVSAWAASTSYAVGTIVRQLATPAVGSERAFVCIVAGTSGSTEPAWTLTKGAKTTDNTATWQEITGQAALNGDKTNAPLYSAVASTAVSLGYTIQDTAADTFFICTTAGTPGSTQPTWNKTAGATTTDGSATWTSLGAVGNFTAWGAPHARLANQISWMGAGDTAYVSNNHAETQSTALALPSFTGSITNPLKIICVNDAISPATATATTASISTTGASGLNLGSVSNVYFYGLNFTAGSSTNSATITIGCVNQLFEMCTFTLGNSSSSSCIGFNTGTISNDPSAATFKNCNFIFGASSQSLNCSGGLGATFIGCTFAQGGSIPSSLFLGGAYFNKNWCLHLKDCDLSSINGTLFDGSFVQCISFGYILVEYCKLSSNVVVYNSAGISNDTAYLPYIKMHCCDSAPTNYRYYFANPIGSAQQETTIVRSGGASDGTTSISWNLTSLSTTSYFMPFISEDIAAWNTLTGSAHSATVYLTSNAALNNNDIWLEVEYLENSANPLGGTVTTKMPLFGTVTALSSDTSTWGGSTANKYKLSVNFTPNMKGVVKARLYLAKPSTTVYVDPVINIV